MIYETEQSQHGGNVKARSHKTAHPELATDSRELHRMSRGPTVRNFGFFQL